MVHCLPCVTSLQYFTRNAYYILFFAVLKLREEGMDIFHPGKEVKGNPGNVSYTYPYMYVNCRMLVGLRNTSVCVVLFLRVHRHSVQCNTSLPSCFHSCLQIIIPAIIRIIREEDNIGEEIDLRAILCWEEHLAARRISYPLTVRKSIISVIDGDVRWVETLLPALQFII